MNGRSRGFTLLETLVALGIAAVLGVLVLRLIVSVLHWSTLQAQRDSEQTQFGALVDRWEADEDSAWAIFTPANDVLGAGNADGHEVDFFTRDGKNRAYFWAYTFDAQTNTLSRYVYGAPGATPTLDEEFTGIRAFYAHTYPVTALADSASKIYSPLYDGAALHAGAVALYPGADVQGGNQITYVRIQGATLTRELQLSTQTAPSGFIVVLRYTPAPTATPQTALAVWPPAVRYAVAGTSLAWDARAPATFGSILNGLLGGGTAIAAGCTTGEAFTDSTFATKLANARDPFGAGITTDANGCLSQSAIAVHEAGYVGTFIDFNGASGSCSSSNVSAGAWVPNTSSGPTAFQFFTAGPSTTMGCALAFSDQKSRNAQATAQVIEPCWAVGGSCSYSPSYLNGGGGDCDASTGTTSGGYDGSGRSSISPATAGTWVTTDGGSSYTFTRTSAGSVTVSVYSAYEQGKATWRKTGLYLCTITTSYKLTSTFTIQSI